MDIKEFQEFQAKLDALHKADKQTGELGIQISDVKDGSSSMFQTILDLKSKVETLEKSDTEKEEKISKLVQANGELMMRTPVNVEYQKPVNPYVQQEEVKESGIENLLGGLKI